MDIKDALSRRKQKEAEIIAKALENSEFREELVENPKATLEKEYGKSMPEGLTIHVVEEDSNSITLVLPEVPDSAEVEGELSDEALEGVAGGIQLVSFLTGVIV